MNQASGAMMRSAACAVSRASSNRSRVL